MLLTPPSTSLPASVASHPELEALARRAAERKMPQLPHAGDMVSSEAYTFLSLHPEAQLIDVRTTAEWAFVGTPDLAAIGKAPLQLSWRVFPSMQPNPNFVTALKAEGFTPSTPLLFLCRSGGRSLDAALAMAQAGFGQCYNIADGFEGEPDASGHRGVLSGWKAAQLPWRQA